MSLIAPTEWYREHFERRGKLPRDYEADAAEGPRRRREGLRRRGHVEKGMGVNRHRPRGLTIRAGDCTRAADGPRVLLRGQAGCG
jgi:hypothetical protein